MAQPPNRRPTVAPALPGSASDDWTVQAADTVERVVGMLRDKTTVPLTTVARALVYGQLAAILGVTSLVLLAIVLVRVIDVYTGAGRVWVAHAAVGGIFTVGGLFLLRKASARKKG